MARWAGVPAQRRWPAGRLAHERSPAARDPWVRRLEMVAAVLHWWNPLFWVAAQMRADAELACDAWAAGQADHGLMPKRLWKFARSTCRRRAGGERHQGRPGAMQERLTMIMRDRVPCQLSPFRGRRPDGDWPCPPGRLTEASRRRQSGAEDARHGTEAQIKPRREAGHEGREGGCREQGRRRRPRRPKDRSGQLNGPEKAGTVHGPGMSSSLVRRASRL